MIKKFSFTRLLLASCLCTSVLAVHAASDINNETAFMAPLVKESLLLDVVQGEQTIVVGERGHILRGETSDENTVLEQVQVPTTVTLTAVDGANGVYLAAGHDATILRSEDKGLSWTRVFSALELDRPFLDIFFLTDTEALAVGGYGLFYYSSDAGKTWEQQQQVSLLAPDDVGYLESIADDPEFYQEELNYIFPHFNRLSRSDKRIYLVGEAGLIARSQDDGQSWERFEVDYFGSFFDAHEISENVIMAVGLRGNMFVKVADAPWEAIETCVTTSLNSIVEANEAHYVVGNNGVVLKIDASALIDNGELNNAQANANEEGCASHLAIKQINTDISSTISNAFMLNGELTAVSANGLQLVE